MASVYPGALDSLDTTIVNTDVTDTHHPAHHVDLADAVNKIEAELGTDPRGSFADVKARLSARVTCNKTADQTINSTTLANVTDMVLPVAVTGIDYRFLMEIFWITGAAGVTQQFDITFPTIGGHGYCNWESTTQTAPNTIGTDMVATQVLSGSAQLHNPTGGASIPAAAAVGFTRVTGILSNPTATGSIQLRCRLETGTTAATLKRGAWGEVYID